ncbi:MAG: hypothetical protein R3308_00825 [Thiohalobacterales bacterium]|nr:hypothetical protein [Thiohalobacterales bacterium]
MQQHKRPGPSRASTISRPGIFSLIVHILKGAFTDGMQFAALFCLGRPALLYDQQAPYHEPISALLVTFLVVAGLLRGCARWQKDLVEYHRHIALSRHRVLQSEKSNAIPGFVPFTRR